ncbi:MAG: Serine hydroxymethyltransferase, partial [uncultured Gemmatimonadaceae bacterium]
DELVRLGSLSPRRCALGCRPRDRAAGRARDASAERGARAHRERELRLAGGARGDGLAAHEQVRGGAAGEAVLRGLRGGGPGRADRDRPREGALRRRARERAAALGRLGQRRRVPGVPQAGRPVPRHGPVERRAPHARLGGELLGAHLQGQLVRRHRRGADRLRGHGAQGARAPAEDDHRRLQRLLARDRLRALRGGGQGGGRALPRRHGALRRPRGGGRLPVAGAARRRGHHHHAQDAARPARGAHPLPRRAREGGGQGDVPRHAGRPARARDRRQGGGVRRGAPAVVQGLLAPGGDQRAGARPRARGARLPARLGRHRQPPDARGPAQQGRHRQGGREDARPHRDHGEQEHRAARDAVALRHERDPHRHPGGDHARDEGARDGAHRRAHRRGPRRGRRRGGARPREGAGARAGKQFSTLPRGRGGTI